MSLRCRVACAVVTSACFLYGCVSPVDSSVVSVDPAGWQPEEIPQVTWTNGDTVSRVSVGVLLRYDRRLLQNGDTVSLWVETTSADSLTVCERYRLVPRALACANGSGLQEAVLPYRHGVVFGHKGEYRFAFRHGGAAPLKGIWAVGVTVQPQ